MTHELAGKAGHRGYDPYTLQHMNSATAAMYATHYLAMTALGHPGQPAAPPTHSLAQLQKLTGDLGPGGAVAGAVSGGHMPASGHAPTSGSKQAKSSKRGSGGGGQGGSNPSAGLGLAVPPGYPHMAPHQYQGQQLAPGAGQVSRSAPGVSGQRAAPAPGATMATMQQYMQHAASATQQAQAYNAMLYAQYGHYGHYTDNRGMGGYPHPGYPAGYHR